MIAVVNEKKCTGCGLCAAQCPNDAIELKTGVARVDPKRCTACGVCVVECFQEAITLEDRSAVLGAC